jgi:hypothetical protein
MKKSTILISFFILHSSFSLQAHTINYILEEKPIGYVFAYYFKLGYQHIIPQGLDHILFIVGLYLLSPKIKSVLWQATAFTVAHTITLILTMKNIIVAPPAIVEPIIALSICFVAIENLFISEIKPWRIVLVFLFGLIHGMGFASSLNEIGLPRNNFFNALITFNIGVEMGQISIIIACYLLFGRWFSERVWYRPRLVYPLSAGIALVAAYWTIIRIV